MNPMNAVSNWRETLLDRREQLLSGQLVDRITLFALHELALATVFLADIQAFWVDERVSLRLLSNNAPIDLLLGAAWPPHFPTWFVLADLLGVEATLLLSKATMVALVYPTYRLGRHFADRSAGYRAAFLVALSPYLAAQAGWLRMYGLLTAVLTWGLWFAVDGRDRLAGGCFTVAAVLHPFGVFGAAWWVTQRLVTDWRLLNTRSVIAAFAPIGVTLGWVVSQQGLNIGPTGVFHALQPGLLRVVLTPVTALVGSPHMLVQVVLVLVATAGIVATRADWRLVLWIVLPVAGLTVGSHLVTPLYRPKYFGFVAPAVAVVISTGGSGRVRQLTANCTLTLMGLAWLQRLLIPAIVARRYLFWFT